MAGSPTCGCVRQVTIVIHGSVGGAAAAGTGTHGRWRAGAGTETGTARGGAETVVETAKEGAAAAAAAALSRDARGAAAAAAARGGRSTVHEEVAAAVAAQWGICVHRRPGGGGGAARMLSAAVSAAQGDSGEWYYMDAQGVEQGPFGLQQMRQWYAAGYFTSELQAKCGHRGELRPFATISEIAVADELTLRPELAAAGDWSMGHAAGSGAAAAAAAMPSVEQSSAQIAAMQQESLAAAVQQPGAGKDEGRSASGRHPTFGSAPWRAEQERRDVFQQHQA
eukprot:SAG25_NODE_3921_length_929_cov_1.114458_1_plen_280_part_01